MNIQDIIFFNTFALWILFFLIVYLVILVRKLLAREIQLMILELDEYAFSKKLENNGLFNQIKNDILTQYHSLNYINFISIIVILFRNFKKFKSENTKLFNKIATSKDISFPEILLDDHVNTEDIQEEQYLQLMSYYSKLLKYLGWYKTTIPSFMLFFTLLVSLSFVVFLLSLVVLLIVGMMLSIGSLVEKITLGIKKLPAILLYTKFLNILAKNNY